MNKSQKRFFIGAGILTTVVTIVFLLRFAGMFPSRIPGGSNDTDTSNCGGKSIAEAQHEFQDELKTLNLLDKTQSYPAEQTEIVRVPSSIGQDRRELHCHFLPLAMTVDGSAIRKYPDNYNPSVCAGTTIDRLPKAVENDKGRILAAAKSVGRLRIRIDSMPGKKHYDPVFWGTAVLVAPKVVATTCHTLSSYIKQKQNGEKYDYELDQAANEHMVIDFQSSPYSNDPKQECTIDQLLTCSPQNDLDFALLSLKDGCEAVKNIQPLTLSNRDINSGDSMAMVAYPDSTHFIDYDTREVFDAELPPSGPGKPRNPYPYAKYVRADIAFKNACSTRSILHPATTTVGESGGVLLDLNQAPNMPLQILAFHTCCATYFDYAKGTPPDSTPACAKIQRTFENQALKSWSLIQDPYMCKILKANQIISNDVNCR